MIVGPRPETVQNIQRVLEKINETEKITLSDLSKVIGWSTGKVQKILIRLVADHIVYSHAITDPDQHIVKVYYSTKPFSPNVDQTLPDQIIIPKKASFTDDDFMNLETDLLMYYHRILEVFSQIKGLNDEDENDADHKHARVAWNLVLKILAQIYELPKGDIDLINPKMIDDYNRHSDAMEKLKKYLMSD